MFQFESATNDSVTFLQNDLASNSFPIFEDLKRSGQFCDATLKVGDLCLNVHKVILAGTIPYFRAMFAHGMIESKQEVISIKEIDPDALELLVNFAYSGEVRICTSNVQSLLVGSSFLQLDKVRDACCDFLIKRLHPNNVLMIQSFADALGCTTLVEATNRYIQMHFAEVAHSGEFINTKFADLKEIISQDKLCTREEEVFEAVISWVKSETLRQKYLVELLMQVRMPLLTAQYLIDHVATEELVRTSPQCRDMLDNAKDYHLLPERRPLLQSFRTRPRCCCHNNGCIYVIGGVKSGLELRTVEIYDPTVDRWQTGERMTVARHAIGVAVIHNKLYAIGGYNGTERFSMVEVFDPELQSWSTAASMNCKRSCPGTAMLFNKLYVCGGYDGVSSLNTVESYDPEKNVWSMVTRMSMPRFAAGVVAFEDHIYVLGGYVSRYSCVDSVERYNPRTRQWDHMPPMLNKRSRLDVATLNGQIYVCGGGEDEDTIHQTAEVYNPSTKQWSYIASMNVKRSGLALVANCGKLYAIGGYDDRSTSLSSVEVYNPKLNRWDFVASMSARKKYIAAGVLPSF